MSGVYVGGAAELDALLYGPQHPGTTAYLGEQYQRVSGFVSQIGTTVATAATQFYNGALAMYDRFNNEQTVRAANAAMRKIRSAFDDDVIKQLQELAALQNAQFTMQRYIMAEPTIRELYNKQRCDGYSETYIDMHPGAIGDSHYDYRRVVNGVVFMNDTEEDDWHVTQYFDELKEGDRELTLAEARDILTTWDFIKDAVASGDDPTSTTGGFL